MNSNTKQFLLFQYTLINYIYNTHSLIYILSFINTFYSIYNI